jgi:hypothetical protein
MALPDIGNTGGNGVAFIVSAGIVYEIIAANCSSPQTTELNAGARAATLMKWVNIGVIQSAVFVAAAVAFEPKRAKPLIAGGVLAAVCMYGLYMHAKAAGLASDAPGTESWTQSLPKVLQSPWTRG